MTCENEKTTAAPLAIRATIALALALLASIAIAAERAEGFIYFQNGIVINHTDNDGTNFTPVDMSPWTVEEKQTGGLSFAVYGGYIYWTSTYSGQIGRAHADGSDFTPSFIALPQPSGRVGDLAVNGSGIYWSCGGYPCGFGAIGHADLDGGNVNPNFIVTPSWLLGGALAADEQGIYWTGHSPEFPGTTTIGHANADGTNVDPDLVSFPPDPLRTPALSLAVSYSHIYWSDQGGYGGPIGRANLDGTGVNLYLVPNGALGTPSIAVEGDHLFYANDESVGRMNLDGTGIEPNFIKPERTIQIADVDADTLASTNTNADCDAAIKALKKAKKKLRKADTRAETKRAKKKVKKARWAKNEACSD